MSAIKQLLRHMSKQAQPQDQPHWASRLFGAAARTQPWLAIPQMIQEMRQPAAAPVSRQAMAKAMAPQAPAPTRRLAGSPAQPPVQAYARMPAPAPQAPFTGARGGAVAAGQGYAPPRAGAPADAEAAAGQPAPKAPDHGDWSMGKGSPAWKATEQQQAAPSDWWGGISKWWGGLPSWAQYSLIGAPILLLLSRLFGGGGGGYAPRRGYAYYE